MKNGAALPATRVLSRGEIGKQLQQMCKSASTRCWLTTWSLGSNDGKGWLGAILELSGRKVKTKIIVGFRRNEANQHINISTLRELRETIGVPHVRGHLKSHAKIFLVDDSVVIGSSNLSSAGLDSLQWEAAVFSAEPEIVARAAEIFRKIEKESAIIPEKYINELSQYQETLEPQKGPGLPPKTPEIMLPRRSSTQKPQRKKSSRQTNKKGPTTRSKFLSQCSPNGRKIYTELIEWFNDCGGDFVPKYGTVNWTVTLPPGPKNKVRVVEATPLKCRQAAKQTMFVCFATINDNLKISGRMKAQLSNLRERLLALDSRFEQVRGSQTVKWRIPEKAELHEVPVSLEQVFAILLELAMLVQEAAQRQS